MIDPTGKRNGRGAYVCDQMTCWDKIQVDSQLLNKALNTVLTPEERQALADYKTSSIRTAVGTPASE